MYIKIRKWSIGIYEYHIYTTNNVKICSSTNNWRTIRGAVCAAIKLATDLGIEFRETEL